MRGLMRGKICIGTFSSVATHVLPPVIARFRADHPDVDYELLMGDYSEIEQWVAEAAAIWALSRMSPEKTAWHRGLWCATS
ncbi:MAG: LysR family transcriptional regulator substrate-binding protein [Collinsella sp.]